MDVYGCLRKSGGTAGERTRTSDPRITNALLYQLSYSGANAAYVKHQGPTTPVGLTPDRPNY
jgi:hypothetical protein